MEDYRRTEKDLTEVIRAAKLDEKSITRIAQALYYPDLSSNANFKLLELSEEMLGEIEKGNDLIFKGALSERVVLCSKNKSYDVRNAEQSNSLLVVPNLLAAQATSVSPLKSPATNGINKSMDKSLEDDEEMTSQPPIIEHEIQHKPILKIFYEYLECRETKPKPKKIQDLLRLTTYTGSENEDTVDRKSLFTRHQLLITAQCAESEFEALLTMIRAIEVNGFMRILDYAYEYRVITLMMSLIGENSWNLDEVDRSETIEALDGIIPTEITSGLFNFYTEPVKETGKFRYIPRMVCRIIAQNVLQEGLKFRCDEFFETCAQALPEGLTFEESYVDGIGIIDRDAAVSSIKGLFEENLPLGLNERLEALFKVKDKWTLEQITPYIELYTTSQLTATSFLAKHVRSEFKDGTRFYFAKHR